MLLETLILPDLFAMAKGGIEHPSATKWPRPSERKVAVRAIYAWHVQIH